MSQITLYIKTFPPLPRRGSDAIMHRLGLKLLSQGLRQIHGLTYSYQALEYRDNPGTLTDPCSRPVLLGSHGKPRLADHPEIHFSLTNCPGLVACAIGDGEIGIDAELPRDTSPALLSKVLTQEEQKKLDYFSATTELSRSSANGTPFHDSKTPNQALSSSDQQIFSRFWTCKEALAKCTGLGLNTDIYRVTFRFSDRSVLPAAAECSSPFRALLPLRFQNKDYYLTQNCLPSGHIISICSAKAIDRVEIRAAAQEAMLRN